jgi:hypothetical protein
MKKLFMLVTLGVIVAACGGAADVIDQAAEAVDDVGDESVFSMEVGLCFDDEDTSATEVSSVPDVPCDEPHDNEVYATAQYTETDTYPGDEAMQSAGSEVCLAEFEGYVGKSYDESELDYFPITPTQGSWDNGDREIVCALYAVSLEKLTGSMQGSGR